MDAKKHARLSCSGASRWIVCPGSINLESKAPQPKDSPYAQEGTNAHALGEYCLINGVSAFSMLGKTLKTDEGKFEITEEMAEAVDVYVDHVNATIAKYNDSRFFIEKKFSLEWLHKDIFGTADAVVYSFENKILHVIDYKHGAGVDVSPEYNYQLQMYALGVLGEMSSEDFTKIETISFEIVQPRTFGGEGVKIWTASKDYLMKWASFVLLPAAIRTYEDDAPLIVGKHCKFCRAIAICPAQINNAIALAKTDFDDPILPRPEDMSGEDVVKVLNISSVFSSWAAEVEAYAQSVLERGGSVPGYKLVAKRAIRQWADVEDAAAQLENILGEEAFTKKLLSVAQAEKVLKKMKLELSEDMVTKPDNGLTIAPVSDKRKEVVPFIEFMDFLE